MERAVANKGLTADPQEAMRETRAKLASTPTCEQCRVRKTTIIARSSAGCRALCVACHGAATPHRNPTPAPARVATTPAPARSMPAAPPVPKDDTYRGRRVSPAVMAMLAGTPDYSADRNRRVSPAVAALLADMPDHSR